MISFNFVEQCPPYSIKLNSGKYLIEGWGASGGGNPSSKGKGAYAKAFLYLSKPTSLLIVVGGKGETSTSFSYQKFQGGCNGGGAGGIGRISDELSNGSGGGGATDIRTIDNTKIFVVAGGGGDSGVNQEGASLSGGYAGADYGGIGEHMASFSAQANQPTSLTHGTENGVGQTGRDGGEVNNGGEGNGGGGGGYRGGYSSQNSDAFSNAGGNGGSSFVNSTLFSRIVMKSGDDYIDSPDGVSEHGHTGNGFLRITEIETITCKKNTTFNFSFFIYGAIIFLIK